MLVSWFGVIGIIATCCLCAGSSDVSLCERYAEALFDGNSAENQTALVTRLVTTAIFGGNESGVLVPGMIQAQSPIRPYLTGAYQYRANGLSPNFTNDTAAMAALADHLVSYVGAIINCSAPAFPPVATADMYGVHRNMNINQSAFDYWNRQFLLSAAFVGVNATDIALIASALTQYGRCGGIVLGGQSQICSDRDCDLATSSIATSCAQYAATFCNQFAAQLFAGGDSVYNEMQLITAIVARAAIGNSDGGGSVVGWLQSPIIGGWFNGSIQYAGDRTINYTNTSNNALLTLAAHMVSYFGLVLSGCDAPGFGTSIYGFDVGTSNMFNAHVTMNITQTAFDAFIDEIKDALTSFGIDTTDERVVNLLSGFGAFGLCGPLIGGYKTQICGADGCELAVDADCALYNGTEPYEPPTNTSICVQHGGDDQLHFITAVVTKVFLNITAANSPLTQFFNGSFVYRENTPNHIRNNASLITHFVSFFAFLLDCDGAADVDGTIADASANGFDMFAVHRNMQITQTQYDFFTSAVIAAVTSVAAINETAIVGLSEKLRSFGRCGGIVNGGRWQICNDEACDLAFASDEPTCEETYLPSICSRYASSSFQGGDSVQNEFALVAAIVSAAFDPDSDGFLARNSTLRQYFDGSLEYNGVNRTLNFTADAALLAALIARKATFIGQFLGCDAPGWGQPTFQFPDAVNSSVWRVHLAMNIDQTVFAAFNDRIVTVVTALGMSSEDISAVETILNQFGRCAALESGEPAQVCGAADCEEAVTADCSLYPEEDDSGDSYTLLIIVIVVVVIAICAIIAVVYLRRGNMANTNDSERANLITQESNDYSSTRM